jgi:hypothetical protein
VVDRLRTARVTGNDTWPITGGTGAIGSGTFGNRGALTGSREASGACEAPDSDGVPRTAIFTLRGEAGAGLTG